MWEDYQCHRKRINNPTTNKYTNKTLRVIHGQTTVQSAKTMQVTTKTSTVFIKILNTLHKNGDPH